MGWTQAQWTVRLRGGFGWMSMWVDGVVLLSEGVIAKVIEMPMARGE